MRTQLTAILVLLCCLVVPALGQNKIVEIGAGRNPKLASDHQGHMWVTYEGVGGGNDVFVRHSEDEGRTWSDEVNVSRTPGLSRNPAIAVENDGGVDLVWQDSTSGAARPDVYFSHSTDGGKTWTEALDISNTPGVSKNPAVATGPHNSVHVVWSDDSNGKANPDIFYSFSFNGGKSWSKPRDISNTPGVSSDPAIAVSKENVVHVVWCDTSSGDARPDIYYSHGSDDAWSRPLNVSDTPGISRNPGIALDSRGAVYLAWADTSRTLKDWDIYFTKSDGNGHFSKPIYFQTPGDSTTPTITVGPDNRLAIVWADTSNNPQAPDIFLVESTNLGAAFVGPTDISQTPGVSKVPHVTLEQGRVIVIWEEVEGGKSSLKLVTAPKTHTRDTRR